jgi:hypothetical protein
MVSTDAQYVLMTFWTSRLKCSQSMEPSGGAMNPSRLQAAP